MSVLCSNTMGSSPNEFLFSEYDCYNKLIKCYKVILESDPPISPYTIISSWQRMDCSSKYCLQPNANNINLQKCFDSNQKQSCVQIDNKITMNYSKSKISLKSIANKCDTNNEEPIELKIRKDSDVNEKLKEEIKSIDIKEEGEVKQKDNKLKENNGASSFNKENYKSVKVVIVPRFKRWGRKEDIKLYKRLRNKLILNRIDEDLFFNTDIHSILNHKNKIIKDPWFNILAERLSVDLNWLRTPYHLLYRIFRLSENQIFSFREDKLLKKLIENSSKEELNLLEIISNFPGKFMSTLRDRINVLSPTS